MNKKYLYIGLGTAAALAAFGYTVRPTVEKLAFAPTPSTIPQVPIVATKPEANRPALEVIAENLEIPWDIVFLPGGDLVVTERTGYLRRIGTEAWRIAVPGVKHAGEGGLLGLALHPRFTENAFVYLYTTAASGSGTTNSVTRYRLDGKDLKDASVILQGIPGAAYHDGGKLVFGPDGYLYVTTGDAGRPNLAQDKASLAGKVLRMTEDGKPAPGNPFGTLVYSIGHRNPQGLTWDAQGRLWETEHGRSGVTTGMDELNLIEPGKNYGWPNIEGDEKAPGMVTPVANSGAKETWAPASLAFVNARLFFGGLRGESLYAAMPDVSDPKIVAYFRETYGRIRGAVLGPDGQLYITTSNTDGRGSVQKGDDKIIRIDPGQLNAR